ncbi:hypothetical protein AB3Y40_05435 [Yoonia sp. R2331]|uniref:hypothetical protein n=1 Tax=Yoonia sp. R2331 TaxID=3237238 RepID=UPI0034E4DEC2
MLDDFDLVTGTEGTKWTRIVTGLVGALLGGLLGYFYSTVSASAAAPSLVYALGGAAVGGFFGAIFSFWVILGLLIVVAVAGVIGYQWLFGGA